MSDGRDADGFTLVGRKRRGKTPTFAQSERSFVREESHDNLKIVQSIESGRNVDKAVVENKILLARDELQISEFYRIFRVSLFESLKELSTALTEKGNVNITDESHEQASPSPETQSNVFQVLESSPRNLLDGADVGPRTTSCPEYGEDEQLSIRTDCNKDAQKFSSNIGPTSKLESSSSEDGFLGDLRDEVTKVKGQASAEVRGQASGEVTGQASAEVFGQPVQIVVCYGLGNFSDCAIARYQLALLLLICDSLKVKSSNCHLYDPRFTAEEMQVLMSLGLKIIPQNEECKRTATEPTLFYMPHCGKPLYNNLLWANWSIKGLANVVIIGNSFNNIQERLPSRVLQDFSYLQQIIRHTREVSVKNNFRFPDIFNDTSIHLFPSERLWTLPNAFWDRDDEPRYDPDTAIEIILSK
ncbi:uncharacterized protein LOC119728529 isoform X2 [Patiria miniata]|uniref:SRR1-like domain-containing protein n=1 Tax=Patiria miniata TaxID=46514 RepID=A0A913ZZI4_PATMI|nr:uncharacterized protein LOC119728529 isoform X2 [Patiria miniata]